MKSLYQYIINYLRQYFDLKLYASILCFLLIFITINYTLDFEAKYIKTLSNLGVRSLIVSLFQGFPFLVTALFLNFFGKASKWQKDPRFWVTFLLGFLIIGLSRGIHWGLLMQWALAPEDWFLLRSSINWAMKLTMVLALFGAFYLTFDTSLGHFYGFTFCKFNMSPYLTLLGIALIFIIIGSFFGDLQSYYPRYKIAHGASFAAYHQVPAWVSILIYEITYATSFITVEFIFRGFLIYAFVKYFGPYSILPMVATYCFLHFGKPATETLSSIFGGYVLGIFALKNKNIWGGVMVHVGVAWSMELFGYLQTRF